MDCNWGKKNNDLSEKYSVAGYPIVLFTEPDGKQVVKLKKRDAATVVSQIEDLAKKYEKK